MWATLRKPADLGHNIAGGVADRTQAYPVISSIAGTIELGFELVSVLCLLKGKQNKK